jgi:ABC-type branched-subunit amino acid transport system substrate-binding protein
VLEPGDTIDRYTIQGSLGAGGMGHVYRAYDARLRRSVALKVLHLADGADSDATGGAARMLREARAAASLDHPNVVAIYDVGEAVEPEALRGAPYLAMELIKGKSLRAFIGSDTPSAERIRWLGDIARALSAAHERGLVHRDIKPENVMIRDDGVVKVLDFGIAKRSSAPIGVSGASAASMPSGVITTTHGIAVGTPLYMAPEQMRGEELDGRTDQFAWGVVAYELLSGKPPWRTDGEPLRFVADVLSRDPEPLAVGDVPARVKDVVMRALAKAPSARFDSMDALVRAMGDASADTAISPPPASGSRAKLAWAIAGLAAIGAVAIAIARKPATTAASPSAIPSATRECASNRDCLRAHEGEAWRCKPAEGICAPLASEDCSVLAERTDLESDTTVYVGTMFPLRGDEGKAYGRSNERAVDLGRRDFAQSLGRFAKSDSRVIRPIAVVACDDVASPSRAARHLVDDVGAVGVIGFRSGAEVVDLAATIFIPRRVIAVAALNTGAAVTAVPQPTGEPRLVWRTTYNLNTTAAPLAELVHDVLEPRVLAARQGSAPVRVAFVRSKTPTAVGFAAELLRTLAFNGVTAIENRDAYLEVVYDDPNAPGAAPDWPSALQKLRSFAPHIVLFLGDDALVTNVIAPLEASWPAREPRPLYATMNSLAPALFTLIGKDASRRHRFFGMTSVSTIETNAKFVTLYNETFDDAITRTIAPNTSYDAFYLLAYAIQALGDRAPTGPNVARAFARLIGPGKPTDVGPADVFDAYNALSAGKNIDLRGSTGKLDFDLDTGEAPVDMAVLCVNADRDGRAFDTIESGLVFDAAARKLVGTMRCP